MYDENGRSYLKRYPTQDQLWNRHLYQMGLLDELPITEPIDELIVKRVEARKMFKEME